MGSLLKTSVLVGFLLLLPALVYCNREFSLDLFQNANCTVGIPQQSYTYGDDGGAPNTTIYLFPIDNITSTFQSAILQRVTAEVLSLIACQAGLECNAAGAILFSFNLSDIGACSTAGPPGTQFDKFLIT